MKRLACIVVTLVALGAALPSAHAQYRNQIFAVGGGYHRLMNDNLDLQLTGGAMIGGEYLWRMMDDHWWFGVKVDIGFRQHQDEYADVNIGTLLESKPGVFLRYVILTHNFRPFIQFGTSFSTLWYFSQPSADVISQYLPHTNWGTVNAMLGVEYVFTRNMALLLGVDGEWMFIWSAADSRALQFRALLNFYI